MSDWLKTLTDAYSTSEPEVQYSSHYVLVSIIQTQGSCPRNTGTRMLVSETASVGTIGGGHLEHRAIAIAREQLSMVNTTLREERFVLGAGLGQCCGGVVHLSFDTLSHSSAAWIIPLAAMRESSTQAILVTPQASTGLTASQKLIVTADQVVGSWENRALQQHAQIRARQLLSDPAPQQAAVRHDGVLYETIGKEAFEVAVFGAGHVGKALVAVLSNLPCTIRWIDSRDSIFPNLSASNVMPIATDSPEDEVADLPRGCHVVIMTHSHAIDQAICEVSLIAEHLGSCSLIGSGSKRLSFERKLRHRGVPDRSLRKLLCPIGIPSITGKHPAEIAIAVAADILQRRERAKSEQHSD